MLYPFVVVVVLTLTHGYNAVRGHRTGSNNSGGAEDLPQEDKQKNRREDNTHNNWNKSDTSDKKLKVKSGHVRTKIHIYIISQTSRSRNRNQGDSTVPTRKRQDETNDVQIEIEKGKQEKKNKK